MSERMHSAPEKQPEVKMKHICKTGEKPGRGTYSCTNCHTEVSVGDRDKLPPCPSCSNNEFTEVR